MSCSASARSRTKSPRRAVKSAPCLLKLESSDPLNAIAAEPLLGASAPPLCPDADKDPMPRRSIPRRPTQCTIGYRYYDVDRNGMRVGRQVPSLRLYGLWLEGIGFAVGGKVRITMANVALLITVVPAVSPPAAKKRRSCEVAPQPLGVGHRPSQWAMRTLCGDWPPPITAETAVIGPRSPKPQASGPMQLAEGIAYRLPANSTIGRRVMPTRLARSSTQPVSAPTAPHLCRNARARPSGTRRQRGRIAYA